MPEFPHRPTPAAFIRKRLRRLGLAGMLVVVAVAFLLSGPRPERLGDRFQVMLPLVALGCAVAEGQTVRLVGRYILLEVFIKGPKYGLSLIHI